MPFFFPFGGQAKSNREVHDHHKIIWSTQFRPDPGSDDWCWGQGGERPRSRSLSEDP